MFDVFLRRKNIKCGATAEHKKSKAPHEKVRLASKPRIEHGPEGLAVTILNLQEYIASIGQFTHTSEQRERVNTLPNKP
jgi:hypothetical protein